MINNLISEKSTDFLNKCASNLVKQRTVISANGWYIEIRS